MRNGPGVSEKLRDIASELRLLDLDLKSQPVPDAALLLEFRRVLDNVRLTVWTVGELINAQHAGTNPQTALSFLTTERLRRFTQMARELTAEMEAGAFGWQTEGLRALSEAVILLQTQTSRLAHDHPTRFRTAGDRSRGPNM